MTLMGFSSCRTPTSAASSPAVVELLASPSSPSFSPSENDDGNSVAGMPTPSPRPPRPSNGTKSRKEEQDGALRRPRKPGATKTCARSLFCKACRRLKWVKQHSAPQPILRTQPLLEAIIEDCWWDVEVVKATGKGHIVRCIDSVQHQEIEVETRRIRLKSRKATVMDCLQLKEGMDVCVFACHPQSSQRAWYDARIVTVERKAHEPACACRFSIHFYSTGDMLKFGGDRPILRGSPKTVGFKRLSILQAPYHLSFSSILEAALYGGSAKRQWSYDSGSLTDQENIKCEQEVFTEHGSKKNGSMSTDLFQFASLLERDMGKQETESISTELLDFASFLERDVGMQEDMAADLFEFASLLEKDMDEVIEINESEDDACISDRLRAMPRACKVNKTLQNERRVARGCKVNKTLQNERTDARACKVNKTLQNERTDAQACKVNKTLQNEITDTRACKVNKTLQNERTDATLARRASLQSASEFRKDGGEQVCKVKTKIIRKINCEASSRSLKRQKLTAETDESNSNGPLDSEAQEFAGHDGLIRVSLSLVDFWNRNVGSDVKSNTIDNELHELWAEMEMCLQKHGILKQQEEVKRSSSRFKDRCEVHEYVLDDQKGLVCEQCGYIGVHIEKMTAGPVRRSYKLWEQENEAEDREGESQALEENSDEPFVKAKRLLEGMHKHQQEAVLFLQRNIMEEKGGCILAHAPGTGKSFTTIAFYEKYKEVNSNCRLLILAPKVMLVPWQREFEKWKVDTPVHILSGHMSEHRKLEVLSTWHKERSVLAMSYSMFAKTRGGRIRQYLLESPDLLILDEGHFPRTENTNIRETLMQVNTKLRILLTGTLFQNNFEELFNIYYLIRPDFIEQLDGYEELLIDEDEGQEKAKKQHERLEDRARKLFNKEIGIKFDKGQEKEALEDGRGKHSILTRSFVDRYDGEVLATLPGLRDYKITLRPTACQTDFLKRAQDKLMGIEAELACTCLCIHPYLLTKLRFKSKVQDIVEDVKALETDWEAGVKMKFVLDLIQLCRYTSEKVLIFSETLPPLSLLTKMLESAYGWSRDKEILRIDGNLSYGVRQEIIERFNLDSDESLVCLASIKACAEGITLTGASRVVFLHDVWNASQMQQAVSRAFRLGQKRKVFVYRLVASVNMEEKKNSKTVWKGWVSKSIFEKITRSGANGKSDTEIFEEDKLLGKLKEDDKDGAIENICEHGDLQNENEQEDVMRDYVSDSEPEFE